MGGGLNGVGELLLTQLQSTQAVLQTLVLTTTTVVKISSIDKSTCYLWSNVI